MTSLLSDEATIQHLLLREGFTSGAEAVAWADSWILRLDDIPDDLIRISLNGGDANEILSALNRLACPTFSLKAFSLLCRVLLDRLEQNAAILATTNLLLWRVYFDNAHGERPLEFEPPDELWLSR